MKEHESELFAGLHGKGHGRLEINGTWIDDTFAEAFGMRFTRVDITAHDEYWLDAALNEVTGYGSSVIGCDAEVGVELKLAEGQTLDGRPGASVLFFGFSADALAEAVRSRVGQCVMTCPTTAVFNGLFDTEASMPLGKHLRFFGDGFQKSKRLGGRRFWRIPVMDGEFIVEDRIGVGKGVAGGNFIIQGPAIELVLTAARRATSALEDSAKLITPFPGGIARSGSKVGSQYPDLIASTADGFCPTLKGRVQSKLHPDANYAVEIVIDGCHENAVADGLRQAIHAACGEGISAISAGNYGGKLGKYSYDLHTLLQSADESQRESDSNMN